MCVCVHSTSPHSSRRGGDSKCKRCHFPLPPAFFPSFLPDSFYPSFSCSFSFVATAVRICRPSLAIILLGYAMHSPPMVTNWCWRPLTLLSLVVGAHPNFHSDCLALWLPLLLYRRLFNGILQLFLLFWSTTCQRRLIQEPACSYPKSSEAGCHRDSADATDICMHWHGGFSNGQQAFLKGTNCTVPQRVLKQALGGTTKQGAV